MAIMNTNTLQEPEAPTEESYSMPGMPMDDDDGVGYEEYKEDIIQNLEAHLNSLPDQAKAVLAEFAVTPEFATVIGIINGEEVGEYFMKYVDPSKKAVVQRVQPAQQSPRAAAPAQPAQQAAPAKAPTAPVQGGGIMNV